MKKSTIINVLLIAFLAFSLIAFGLQVKNTNAYWLNIQFYYDMIEESEHDAMWQEALNTSYEYAWSLTFSLVFCALSAIASAVLLVLTNRGGFAELKARAAQRKEQAAIEKASRTEARKVKKIAKLEQKIKDLSDTEK